MIEVSLPGLFISSNLNMTFVNMMEKNPEKFRDDVYIGSVYGSFPCCWNGGRIIEGYFDMNDVINLTKFYNSKNIKIRYTFTNGLIGPDELEEWIPNQILQLTKCNQTLTNEINVSSQALEEHLRNVHPEFNLIYSTTKMLSTVEEIDKASENNIVVPDYSVNSNLELLKKLKHPENIELIASEACFENCPNRKNHYINISKIQLCEDIEYMKCSLLELTKNGDVTITDLKNRKHNISYSDMKNKYLPLNINKVKITGRKDSELRNIEAYIDYLVKDEYQDEVRLDLINSILSRRF